jgi:DNA-binding MarR family transcriptional regulator
MSHRLQEEIKQTRPFQRPGTEALLGILRTAALLEHQASEVLKPYGITTTQYNVLRILRGAGAAGMCGREIAERLVSRVPDTPRLLDRMEEAGLIQRERDANDRRHVTARIAGKGLKLLERATPDLDELEATRLEHLDPESLQSLINTLDDIRAGV